MPTSDISPLLAKGLSDNFLIEYKKYPKTYPELFHMRGTKSRFVDVQGWIGRGLPTRRDPRSAVAYDGVRPNFGYRRVVAGYSQGDVVADEDAMDDQYGMVVRWASAAGGEYAVAYATLEDRLAADYIAITGFTTTSPAPDSPDGDPLFSTTHPMSRSDTTTNASNRPSTDVDLGMGSLQSARASLEQQFAPNGVTLRRNNIKKLFVNPNIAEIAYQLARGGWTPNTADNNINTMQGSFKVVTWPYFRRSGATQPGTTWNAWFVQGEEHFMCWYDREQVVFDSDKDVETRSTIYTSHRRFTYGHDDWRGMYGSVGAG